MTASGFRVGVTGLVFVFKLASLALKQVSNCIQKPKTNTFGKLIKFLYQLLHGLFLVVLDGFRSFQMVLGRFRLFLGRFSSFLTLVSTLIRWNISQGQCQRKSILIFLVQKELSQRFLRVIFRIRNSQISNRQKVFS